MSDYNPNSIWTSKEKESRPLVVKDTPKNTNMPNKAPVARGGVVKPKESSGWRGPIWFAVALLVVIGAILGFYFFSPSQSLNVTVALTTDPATMVAGDQFVLSAAYANNSAAALQGAVISLVLPNGVVSVDTPDARVVEASLGDVAAGVTGREDFHLAVVGAPNTVEHFAAKITYGQANSSANFENDASLDAAVGPVPAVTVQVSAPPSATGGSTIPITVTYANTTDHPIQNLSIAMQYPPAFTFISASSTLAPSGNANWNLGTIPANGNGTILIIGNIIGTTNASYPIEADLTETLGGQSYPLSATTANVVLGASPLSFTLAVNNSENYIAEPGDTLNYMLSYTNNSDVAFQNVIISANVAGSMFDLSSLTTDGSFNSVTDAITWNGATSPQLLSLAPGQSGSVDFRIATKQAFPIRLLSDKNYTVAVRAKLTSPTVPPGTVASGTIAIADLTTKFGGQISLAANGYFRAPVSSGGFADTGPYPPRVNQSTQYNIDWLVTNYATDAANVTISATLQSGTTCTGQMKIPSSTVFACDPSNGQVTWTIPTVAATTGITGKPLEAVFQVANTPAVNEVGQDVTLLSPSTLVASDTFTGQTMQASAPSITTALPDDTSASGGASRQVTN